VFSIIGLSTQSILLTWQFSTPKYPVQTLYLWFLFAWNSQDQVSAFHELLRGRALRKLYKAVPSSGIQWSSTACHIRQRPSRSNTSLLTKAKQLFNIRKLIKMCEIVHLYYTGCGCTVMQVTAKCSTGRLLFLIEVCIFGTDGFQLTQRETVLDSQGGHRPG
jgi:hypothetical protein